MATTKKHKTWRNLLLDAAALIERTGWTRLGWAQTKHKEFCDPSDPTAAFFCASGALNRAFLDGGYSLFAIRVAMERLMERVEPDDIPIWNDNLPVRSGKRTVIKTLRAVAGVKT